MRLVPTVAGLHWSLPQLLQQQDLILTAPGACLCYRATAKDPSRLKTAPAGELCPSASSWFSCLRVLPQLGLPWPCHCLQPLDRWLTAHPQPRISK